MAETRLTPALRRAVRARARGCCEYCRCQARFSTEAFSVEHVVPRSRGGATVLDNLALACQGCNNHKYAKVSGRDPASGAIALLFHPRQQVWREHFAWSPDYTTVLGLTVTGRATVVALRLNREGVVNLRRVLHRVGEHPPPEK